MKNNKSHLVLEEQATGNQEASLIVFALGDKRYGGSVSQVCEVIHMVEVSDFPGAPSFIAGVINLRGKVVPIIDLRKCFKIPSTVYTLDNAILIVEIKGKTVGIIVDRVCEVVSIPRTAIERPGDDIAFSSEFVEEVVRLPEGLLLIVDFNKVLNFEEKKQLEKIVL